MDNKIIDINEWLRWVIKKHPSQKQITTIKKYWSCHTIKDYCTKFKNDIRKDIYDNLKQNNFEAEWKDNSYSWDLDRLFDIQKFVKDCPQLSKVNIGYFASFIDKEEICNHCNYLGTRLKRGLFKTNKGLLINADINGSLNILRKEVSNAFTDERYEI